MWPFKKKEKDPEVLYDSKISLDAGANFFTAEEIWPVIEKNDLWGKIYDALDPEILKKARKKSLSGAMSILRNYLSYSPVNLVFGNKKDVIVVSSGARPFRESSFFYNNVAVQFYCGHFRAQTIQNFQKYTKKHFGECSPCVFISPGRTAESFNFEQLFEESNRKISLEDEVADILAPPGVIIELLGFNFFAFGGEILADCLKDINTPSAPLLSNATEETIAQARATLDKYNWEVDYVITGYAPNRIHTSLAPGFYTPNIITNFFDELEEKLKYKHWYVGNYNMDFDFDGNITALYNKCGFINGVPKVYDEIEIKKN